MSTETTSIKKTIILIVIFMAILVIGFYFRMITPRHLSDRELKANGAYVFETPRQISEFSLIDENVKPFTTENLKGQWTLLFFGYTWCPDICPTTMADLNKFYKKIVDLEEQDNIQVIMVSVDPARDTPEKLKEYVNYFNEDFSAVTGEFLDIKRFANELNTAFVKVPGGGENYMIDHSGNIVLINPYGHYAGFFKPPFNDDRLLVTFRSIQRSFKH